MELSSQNRSCQMPGYKSALSPDPDPFIQEPQVLCKEAFMLPARRRLAASHEGSAATHPPQALGQAVTTSPPSLHSEVAPPWPRACLWLSSFLGTESQANGCISPLGLPVHSPASRLWS